MLRARRGGAVVVGIGLICTSSPAPAEWSSNVFHDLTGHLQVSITGEVNGGGEIQATCDTGRNATLSLMPADPAWTAGGAILGVEAENGEQWSSHATPYRSESGLTGLTYANADDIPAIVTAIGDAAKSILIRVENPTTGRKSEWRADARGSTAAARRFLDNCFPTN